MSTETAAAARDLLALGLGGGRLTWADPEVRPGERLRWRVAAIGSPDVIIETRRGEPPMSEGAENNGSESWTVTAGDGSGPEATVILAPGRTVARRLVWREPGRKDRVVSRESELARVYGPVTVMDEEAFTEAGGTFLGNEVVRVNAGEFRARHAMLSSHGSNWHFYVTTAVPGGLVKLERFESGAMAPNLVLELEDFTRLPAQKPGGEAPPESVP